MQELKTAIAAAVKKIFEVELEPELSRPEEKFGDYATNVALQLASKLNKPPREIAEQLAAELKDLELISKTEVAGPGFINLWLNDSVLLESLNGKLVQNLNNHVSVIEYSDPNPFKELHVGHLYDGIVGDAVANLYEAAGATVHRVNFGGDVGLHVAKALWAILQKLGGENPEKLAQVSQADRAKWMGEAYVLGATAYEEDESAKVEITSLNQRVYEVHEKDDHDSAFAQIYWTARQWSYDYFDEFYNRIGTKFEKYYLESLTAPVGLKVVKEQLSKGIFEESEGAVVFKGETHNLHTRVFINSQGLPTYEAKEIGLAFCKWQDYHFDSTIILSGNEIVEYMQVVLAALKQFAPDIAKRTTHLTHGMVKLPGKQKMSSRRGNVITAEAVLEMTKEANNRANNQDNEAVSLGAIKYAFLKQRLGGDIIYDPADSVSIEGNSGPYLQYAYARAQSILEKLQNPNSEVQISDLEPGERSLARKISEYPEVVAKATSELMPHHIATYLYELAQSFNRFYEQNRVVDDPREALRAKLVGAYSKVLKNGLELLNIPVLEQMK